MLPEYDLCKATAPEETPANQRCRELIDACLDPKNISFALPDGDKPIRFRNQEDCTRSAPILAGISALLAPAPLPPAPAPQPSAQAALPPAPLPPAPTPLPSDAPASTPPGAVETSWRSDGERRFDRRLGETGFREFSAKGGSKAMVLHLPYRNDAKHIPIIISYTIAEANNGRMRMTYSIVDRKGRMLSPETALEFQAVDGVRFPTELAFALELAESGDFRTIDSLRIIPLP